MELTTDILNQLLELFDAEIATNPNHLLGYSQCKFMLRCKKNHNSILNLLFNVIDMHSNLYCKWGFLSLDDIFDSLMHASSIEYIQTSQRFNLEYLNSDPHRFENPYFKCKSLEEMLMKKDLLYEDI